MFKGGLSFTAYFLDAIVAFMSDGHTTVVITSGTILRTLLFMVLMVGLYYLRDLALIILTAVVLASSIEPGILWFGKRGVGRLPAVIIMYLLIAIMVVTFFYFFVPPVLDDLVGFLGTLPQQATAFSFGGESGIMLFEKAFESIDVLSLQQWFSQFRTAISGTSGGVVNVISTFFGGILSFILILVLSFYFAVQETGIDDFLRIITPVRHQEYVLGLWKRAQFKIGLWMQGQILLALIVGVLAYLGLTILGVPYALLLAILAAFFELIPIFGPLLAAIPGIIIAFGEAGTSLALMTIALYVIIQQFENHLIYPLVVRKVVGVPPLLVIIALIAGGKLAGFLGIILSVPVAAALREYVDDIQKAKNARSQVPLP